MTYDEAMRDAATALTHAGASSNVDIRTMWHTRATAYFALARELRENGNVSS